MTGLEALARDHHFDRQVDLARQHWASVRSLWLDDPDVAAARKLRAALPRDFWISAGMPGLATVKLTGAGRFAFTEDGLTAIIVPAYAGLPGRLDANAEAHVVDLVDLVAVDLDHPDRFWRRRGHAVVLGNVFPEIAGQELEPVPVFRTPLSWLRSGGAGICVLDWDYVRDLLLDHELVAEDLALGAELDAELRPHIWIRGAAA